MSSYCPQSLYFTMNGANYYYAQSCDSCSYVCIAINDTPNCGGCCANCCPQSCPGLITNADHPMVALLKTDTIATIPVAQVRIPRPVEPGDPVQTFTSPISIDTDDSVTLVDDDGNVLCKLRLLGVRVATGDGNNWLVMHIGQQLDPNAATPDGEVKKIIPSTGKYHRVKFPRVLDMRVFDVITFDDIDEAVPPAPGPAPAAARRRGRGRR